MPIKSYIKNRVKLDVFTFEKCSVKLFLYNMDEIFRMVHFLQTETRSLFLIFTQKGDPYLKKR